jgi:L-amino acid N-acyltransferase YncA
VASNCKQVVDDIKEGILGKYGSIIQEITAQTNQFAESVIEFEGRSSNFKAHNLARYVLSIDAGRTCGWACLIHLNSL